MKNLFPCPRPYSQPESIVIERKFFLQRRNDILRLAPPVPFTFEQHILYTATILLDDLHHFFSLSWWYDFVDRTLQDLSSLVKHILTPGLIRGLLAKET